MIEPSPRIFEMIHARLFAMHRTKQTDFVSVVPSLCLAWVCLCCFFFWFSLMTLIHENSDKQEIFLDENEAFQLPRTNLLKRDVCLSKTASRQTTYFFSTTFHSNSLFAELQSHIDR